MDYCSPSTCLPAILHNQHSMTLNQGDELHTENGCPHVHCMGKWTSDQLLFPLSSLVYISLERCQAYLSSVTGWLSFSLKQRELWFREHRAGWFSLCIRLGLVLLRASDWKQEGKLWEMMCRRAAVLRVFARPRARVIHMLLWCSGSVSL